MSLKTVRVQFVWFARNDDWRTESFACVRHGVWQARPSVAARAVQDGLRVGNLHSEPSEHVYGRTSVVLWRRGDEGLAGSRPSGADR